MEVILKSDYKPSGKGIEFHTSSARFKVLVGGYGSGKTKMGVEEIIALMSEHPGIEIFVMRKTMPALRDSTLNEFLKIIPHELGVYNGRTDTFRCHNGSKMMFRGLDEPSKLKSTNVAVIVWDEAEEFTLEDFRILNARLRQRKPDGTFYPLHFILILNPVDEQHWIYKEFVINADHYKDPLIGGLLLLQLSTYDNIENLPPNYIEQTTIGMTPQEIERYIGGQWGTIVKGKGVYTDVFNPELHLRKWSYDASMLIVRGWDFGFNHPACVWRLKDLSGRKNIDFELIGDKEHITPFARRVMALTEQRYGKNLKVYDYCDPRGFDKKDTGQSSVDALNELGIYPVGERGTRNYVEPGIQVVRKELSTLISGVPELTINPECVITKAAYGGRYVRDDEGNPKKDGYYEHVMDADRYTAFNDKSNTAVKDAMIARQRKVSTIMRNKYTGY